MDVTLIGRNVGITDSFRTYAEEKSAKVEHLADRALALEIRLCRHHETNGVSGDDRVELTLIGPGPVVQLPENCTVLTWDPITEPLSSLTSAELLEYWHVTKGRKLYYYQPDASSAK